MRLIDIAKIVRGSSPRPQGDTRYFGGSIPRLMIADITRDGMYVTPQIDSLTEEGAKLSRPMKKNDIVIAVSGNPGLPAILSCDCCIHDGFAGLRDLDTSKIIVEYLYYVLAHKINDYSNIAIGGIFKNLTTDDIKNIEIPVPSLQIQQEIVSKLDAEIAYIKQTEKVIEVQQGKIKNIIAKLWQENSDKLVDTITQLPNSFDLLLEKAVRPFPSKK